MERERKRRARRNEPSPLRGELVLRGDLLDPAELTATALANEEI